MEITDILNRVELGEDSVTQFKENITSNSSLAEEMVAFSNAIGGVIYVGIKDDGNIIGLSPEDIRRLNNMISNVASEHVKPPVTPITKTLKIESKVILLIELKQGTSKPYSTNNGTYLTKSGADKRRISQEELQRLFQESNRLHADEMIVSNSKISDIDYKSLSAYYLKEYSEEIDNQDIDKNKVIENLYLGKNGQLTLAGLLLFGKNPQIQKPMFAVKAVSFAGNDLAESVYRDSEDILGDISTLYKNAIGFLLRNLHKIQNGKSVNSTGDLEIPRIVLEEILVNAIIHRDYFIDAPINLFIFDNRIEIISPGKLPNSINIENIKLGISVMRNPIITSFASKYNFENS